MLPGMPGAAPGVFMDSLFTPSGAEAGVVTGVEEALCEAPGPRARLLGVKTPVT